MPPIPRLLALITFPLLGATPLRAQWSTDNLSAARGELSGVVHGQKAYFAGGRVAGGSSTRTDVIDVYDDASGTWSQATLSSPRSQMGAVAVGPYVLFAGGAESPTTSSAVVDFLDTTTMTWSSAAVLSKARFVMGAATVGSKALFAGGAGGGPMAPAPSAVVDVYDSALGPPDDPLAWSTATISVARGQIAATTIGARAFFAGGLASLAALDTVDVYDDVTGMWSVEHLSQARALGPKAAATVGSRAYFAGGVVDATTVSDVVDVYDADFDFWYTLTLPVARGFVTTAGLGDLLVIAGGATASAVLDHVDVLATGSGVLATSHLSAPRFEMAAGVVGNRALFAGGFTVGGAGSDTVDVLQCVAATVSPYAGDGINADTIAPVAMVLGQPWSAPLTIGHPHGAGGPTQLKVRTSVINGANVTSPIGGRPTEILVTGPLLVALAASHDGATGNILPLTVPPTPDLLGLTWAAQYVVVGGGFADLSQAVQGTIGCF